MISSAGRRVELINGFKAAADDLGISLRIIATDSCPDWSPACQIADRSFQVPRCTSDRFIETMLDICSEESVVLIIPTIDTELSAYSENTKAFESIGTRVLVADPETTRIIRDKLLTVALLTKNGIPTPATWKPDSIINSPGEAQWPILVKPRDGSCSVGVELLPTVAHLEDNIKKNDNLLVQEYCKGKEYTVNAFYDGEGNCVSCIPHYRKMVRAGEVCLAQTERIETIIKISEKLGRVFPNYYGCMCFQGIMDEKGAFKVFEINGRFGGGYPICDKAGGAFVRWLLQKLLGISPDYHNNWKSGLKMLRYDAAVFT